MQLPVAKTRSVLIKVSYSMTYRYVTRISQSSLQVQMTIVDQKRGPPSVILGTGFDNSPSGMSDKR